MDTLTKYTMEELACPKCGKVHLCKRYSVINVTEKPELKEQVLRNKLYVFTCEGCGLTAPLTYESVYVDTKKNLLIYLAPEMTENTKKSIELWEKENHRNKRIVDNLNDLKEKIMIAEQLMDDRIIEFMKIEHLNQLKKEMEDDTLMNILFDYDGSNFYFMVFFEKKGIGRIPFTSQYYRDAERRYGLKLSKKISRKFVTVDMQWAGNLLMERN